MGDQAMTDASQIVLNTFARSSGDAFRLPGDSTSVDTAHVDGLIAVRDAAGLVALVCGGDIAARWSAGRLIGVAIDARHAGLLAALRAMPDGPGGKVDEALAVLLIATVTRSPDMEPVRILLAAGFPPDRAHGLHHARTAGAVRVLLDAGADPNLIDELGWRPGANLLQRGSLDALEALLDGGADTSLFLRSARRKQQVGLEERLDTWLAGLPGTKPWFQALAIADPTAPWAMRLLARLGAAANEDVGSQSNERAST